MTHLEIVRSWVKTPISLVAATAAEYCPASMELLLAWRPLGHRRGCWKSLRKGCPHHLGARDKSRADVTLTRLRERGRRLSCAELTRVADMTRVAAQIASQEPRIDVLIAGALFATRQVTLCAEARSA